MAAAAERSWAIQRELARIDADREAFVNQLLSEWSAIADPNMYDLWSELGPAARRVPAWQLYGASLVGDFRTMGEVLRGQRGAGKYINALSEPEAKISPSLGDPAAALDFGGNLDSLVFTPIAPCRVVDTRGVGARTGVLAAGTSRSFDLEDDAFTSGQGGTSPCPGLPISSPLGWAINVTVTNFAANGGLQIYPFLGAVPATSAINFSAGMSPSVANGLAVTGCYLCADDINIRAFGAATDVIVDVMGYFHASGTTDASLTRAAGTATTIGVGVRTFILGGFCAAGTTMVGGEVSSNALVTETGDFVQNTGTQWSAYVHNGDASPSIFTVFSRCLDTPIEVP